MKRVVLYDVIERRSLTMVLRDTTYDRLAALGERPTVDREPPPACVRCDEEDPERHR